MTPTRRFPLHQLTGEVPTLTPLPTRRHAILDDQEPPPGAPRASRASRAPRAPRAPRADRKPLPPARRARRGMRVQHLGKPNLNAAVLTALLAGGLTFGALCKQLNRSSQAMSRVLHQLTSRNLVSREGAQRRYTYFLTPSQATQARAALDISTPRSGQ